MTGLDRERREVHVAAVVDDEGREVTPQRAFGYDTLVIAVGSQSNDFGTPGVREHAMKLEIAGRRAALPRAAWSTPASARMRRPTPLRPEQLQVAIIGAGATGVELAAELHRTTREVVAYGLDRVDPDKDIQVTLIEAADRVLPALPRAPVAAPPRTCSQSSACRCTPSATVAEVLPDGVRLADGRVLPAELVVWAAGVKAPDFLKDLGGLETNRINQLVVRPTLQTTRDDDIFAIGDCAACPWPGHGHAVPPRAQAAHQQATHLYEQIRRRLAGKPLQDYALPRLRLAGVARRVQHRRQPDGRPDRRQPVDRGRVRAPDVPVALQDARARAARPGKVALDTLARLITRRTEPHVSCTDANNLPESAPWKISSSSPPPAPPSASSAARSPRSRAPSSARTSIKALLERSRRRARADQRSHHGPGADRRRRPEPGAPGADQGRAAAGGAGADHQHGLRLAA